MILAADIGGTKTLVAMCDHTADGLRRVREARFPSRSYGSLEAILVEFLGAEQAVELEAACFGVAGPVIGGVCIATNLPWRIEERRLAAMLNAPVRLLNDVEAAAYGMLYLEESDFAVINAGAQAEQNGNIALLAAGTGLGEAILHWDGQNHTPIATEGGHADFAPHSEQEIELLRFLRAKYGGHVSYERILSGPGLQQIYLFLRQARRTAEPDWLTRELQAGDPAAAVTRSGLERRDAVCVEALDMFAHIYGVEAGNLALKCLATGGVFLGGGIAPRILPALQTGSFMAGFTDKGRLGSLLEGIRVSVALNTQAPLIGAAFYALRLTQGPGAPGGQRRMRAGP